MLKQPLVPISTAKVDANSSGCHTAISDVCQTGGYCTSLHSMACACWCCAQTSTWLDQPVTSRATAWCVSACCDYVCLDYICHGHDAICNAAQHTTSCSSSSDCWGRPVVARPGMAGVYSHITSGITYTVRQIESAQIGTAAATASGVEAPAVLTKGHSVVRSRACAWGLSCVCVCCRPGGFKCWQWW
jgi:hypothetical protein